MNKDLAGKKILILGGAHQHLKLVETAKEMGIITYVTDFLDIEYSPAKQIADYEYRYNITDIDSLVTLCKKESIDGIVAPYLDISQNPYCTLCERMGLPCFGNKEQHKILTDKNEFKKFCEKHGVDVIFSYNEDEIMDPIIGVSKVEYPIIIKPCDSRGSRGQTVCYSHEEAVNAIDYAKSESRSGNIAIEKYMGSENDLQLVYMVIEGEPILIRVEDRYLGDKDSGLDKLAIASIEPSIHEKKYRKMVDNKVVSMLKAIGLKNSPVFIQGIFDGNTVRFYDPGIRMPGDEYDRIYKSVTGIDLPELLIRFAITGNMSVEKGRKIRNANINKATAMIYSAVRPGKIAKIEGIEEIRKNSNIIFMTQIYKEGDVVGKHYNVRQRFGEFDIECDDFIHLQETIEWLFDTFHVYDENGQDMVFAKFNTKNLEKYIIRYNTN